MRASSARAGGARRPDRRRGALPVKGIVHRYPDRVLLKLVHVCPVYCRFCFRREMVGPGGAALSARGARRGARLYRRARPEIWEVILTGGDPLVLSPRRLPTLIAALAAIDHVKVVRFHTPRAGRGARTGDDRNWSRR